MILFRMFLYGGGRHAEDLFMPWAHPKPTAPTSADEGEDAKTKAGEADSGTEEGNGAAAAVPEEIGADRLWLRVHVPPSVLTGDS